jgi:hypothetical protein
MRFATPISPSRPEPNSQRVWGIGTEDSSHVPGLPAISPQFLSWVGQLPSVSMDVQVNIYPISKPGLIHTLLVVAILTSLSPTFSSVLGAKGVLTGP